MKNEKKRYHTLSLIKVNIVFLLCLFILWQIHGNDTVTTEIRGKAPTLDQSADGTSSLSQQEPSIAEYGMLSGAPYLPVRRSSGLTDVLLRDVRPQEVPQVYSMFSSAARAGHGYSVSEIGDYEEFTRNILRDNITFVMADPATDAVIYAMVLVTDGKFVRHSKRVSMRGRAAVNPDYRPSVPDPDLFKVIFQTLSWIGYHMGFQYLLATGTLHHGQLYRALSNETVHGNIVGTLPDGIYMQGSGWTDMVIYDCVLLDNFTGSDFTR